MSNPMAIGGVGAMKLEQSKSARDIAKAWANAMREHRLSALGVFLPSIAGTDAGGFFLGYLREALDAEGFTIEHMQWVPIDQTDRGVLVFRVNMLLVSKTGKAQSVLLA